MFDSYFQSHSPSYLRYCAFLDLLHSRGTRSAIVWQSAISKSDVLVVAANSVATRSLTSYPRLSIDMQR